MNIFNPELEVFMENGKKTVDSTVHDSAQSMKDSNRVGCSIREHLKNVRQRTDLNFCNNPRLSRAALRRSSQSRCDLVSSFFFQMFHCFNVRLFKCFSTSYFPVPGSRFLLRKVKIRIFTLIELLMRESCKSGISFRQQGWTGRCQSPDPASSFFLRLLNCSNVRLFQCFSVPSSFHVPCSSVLTSRGKTRVFTLIELLIVISIIAILAAMLLPALNKARQTAQGISCIGKVRQILIATQAYLGDSNGVYYSVYLGPYLSGNSTTDNYASRPTVWMEYLLLYMGRKELTMITRRDLSVSGPFGCPSQAFPDKLYPGYGYFSNLFGDYGHAVGSESSASPGVKQSRIPSPSKHISHAEACGGNDTYEKRARRGNLKVHNNTVAYRHRRKANVGWVDGHVSGEAATLLIGKSTGLPWDQNLTNTPWTKDTYGFYGGNAALVQYSPWQ